MNSGDRRESIFTDVVDKVSIAQQIRAETDRAVSWISHRLHLASRIDANHLFWKGTD